MGTPRGSVRAPEVTRGSRRLGIEAMASPSCDQNRPELVHDWSKSKNGGKDCVLELCSWSSGLPGEAVSASVRALRPSPRALTGPTRASYPRATSGALWLRISHVSTRTGAFERRLPPRPLGAAGRFDAAPERVDLVAEVDDVDVDPQVLVAAAGRRDVRLGPESAQLRRDVRPQEVPQRVPALRPAVQQQGPRRRRTGGLAEAVQNARASAGAGVAQASAPMARLRRSSQRPGGRRAIAEDDEAHSKSAGAQGALSKTLGADRCLHPSDLAQK